MFMCYTYSISTSYSLHIDNDNGDVMLFNA